MTLPEIIAATIGGGAGFAGVWKTLEVLIARKFPTRAEDAAAHAQEIAAEADVLSRHDAAWRQILDESREERAALRARIEALEARVAHLEDDLSTKRKEKHAALQELTVERGKRETMERALAEVQSDFTRIHELAVLMFRGLSDLPDEVYVPHESMMACSRFAALYGSSFVRRTPDPGAGK